MLGIRAVLYKFLTLIMLVLLFIDILSGCCASNLKKGLKQIGGGVIYLSYYNNGITKLKKYDVHNERVYELNINTEDLRYPTSILEGKKLLCSRKNKIYSIYNRQVEKLLENSSDIKRVSHIENDKIAYISESYIDKTYLTISDLKNGKSISGLNGMVWTLSYVTFVKDKLFVDSDENIIYRVNIEEDKLKPSKFIRGRFPTLCPDGEKLAYVEPDHFELIVMNLRSKKKTKTNIKHVQEIAWIKNTNYIIVEQRIPFKLALSDYIRFGIVDFTTGEYVKLKIPGNAPGDFGYGVAWVDF